MTAKLAAPSPMTPVLPSDTVAPAVAPPTDGARPVMPGTQRFVITGAALALGIAALHFGRVLLMRWA